MMRGEKSSRIKRILENKILVSNNASNFFGLCLYAILHSLPKFTLIEKPITQLKKQSHPVGSNVSEYFCVALDIAYKLFTLYIVC